MQTRILSVESAALFESAVMDAVRLLGQGMPVALPTETVYGLAANALDPQAVEMIYEAKGRPSHNPIIVHVSSLSMARRCVSEWPESAEVLARHFWPGPLTLVLPRAGIVPDVVAAGGPTVGIRFPLHPLIKAVIERCEFPLAAPSANRSNELSPTTADHVMKSLGGKIPLIVDAGPTSVGIESTALDLSSRQPTVLRLGMISARQIAQALGVEVRTAGLEEESAGLKSPGRLQKHYSPRARLLSGTWKTDAELQLIARKSGESLEKIHVIAHERIPGANPFGRVAIIPHDSEAYARAIYAELHRSDQLGAALIIVESLPASAEWDGIRDRLMRASGGS